MRSKPCGSNSDCRGAHRYPARPDPSNGRSRQYRDVNTLKVVGLVLSGLTVVVATAGALLEKTDSEDPKTRKKRIRRNLVIAGVVVAALASLGLLVVDAVN